MPCSSSHFCMELPREISPQIPSDVKEHQAAHGRAVTLQREETDAELCLASQPVPCW